MKVILLENIEKLGNQGDVVNVKAGFARNFLFAKGLATNFSPKQLIKVENELRQQARKVNREKESLLHILDQIADLELSVSMKSEDNDKLFGSVTSMDLQKALIEQNIEIEKQDILLDNPIKSLGSYDIPIRVTSSLKQNIKVNVVKK